MLALILFFTLSHILSFFCSILEAVLLSCTHTYTALLRKQGNAAASILEELKANIDQPLAAILTLNTIAHTMGAAGVGASVVEVFGSRWLALSSTLLTLTMLYWTEMIPKTIGALYWKKLAPFCAPVIKALIWLTYPFVFSFTFFARRLSKGKRLERISEEDIRVALEAGTHAGVIEEAEQDMVENIFRLGDRRVGMVMVPRVDIEWLDSERPLEELCQQILHSHHQRFPLCKREMDRVFGFLKARDVLARAWAGEAIDLSSLAVAPLFVYENQRVFELLDIFHRYQETHALVTDEYGTIQGMVTLGTILQAVVKDRESEGHILPVNNRSWIVHGHLPIDELKEWFHFETLPGEERARYRTLSGLCMYQLGAIPRKGDHFHVGPYRFEILSVHSKRVEKVLLSREDKFP